MAIQKRDSRQRSMDAIQIREWIVKGWTLSQMAVALAKIRPYVISATQIYHDVKKQQKVWQQESLLMQNQSKERLLAEINMVRQEAWAMLAASKKNSVKTKEESEPIKPDPDAVPPQRSVKVDRVNKKRFIRMIKMVRETHAQYGDAALLKIVLECNKREAELMGLDAPKQIESDVAVHMREPQVQLYLPQKELLEPQPGQPIDVEEINPNQTNNGEMK